MFVYLTSFVIVSNFLSLTLLMLFELARFMYLSAKSSFPP